MSAKPWLEAFNKWCEEHRPDLREFYDYDFFRAGYTAGQRAAEQQMLEALEELVELFKDDAEKMRRGWIADAMRGPAALNHDQADAVIRYPLAKARAAIAEVKGEADG